MPEEPKKKRKEEERPDRPLECTECRKPIVYHYTEIVGNQVTHIGMCSECPVLQKRLHGLSTNEAAVEAVEGGKAGLVCGECGTTLEAVRRGAPLGCSVCYDVFGDVLLPGLLSAKKVSPSTIKKKKTVSLHIGRAPGESLEISPSLQLLALNEALDETLKREDYEQAAWLRDQIKSLTGETKGNNAKEK